MYIYLLGANEVHTCTFDLPMCRHLVHQLCTANIRETLLFGLLFVSRKTNSQNDTIIVISSVRYCEFLQHVYALTVHYVLTNKFYSRLQCYSIQS